MSSRWTGRADVPRGDAYDARFRGLEADGADVHGEADLVDRLLADRKAAVLDAGCGTGRVAIELARRGHDTVGVDLDPTMLAAARAKAPELVWIEADLVDLDLGRRFDAVVLAGNVCIFLSPGTEAAAVARAAAHLVPGGLLVAGFQVGEGRYRPDDLDAHATDADLGLVARWATWNRDPWPGEGDYQVSVHR